MDITHTCNTTHRQETHTHTHKETSTHSHSQGQRLSESQVRTHRQSGKHTNPEKQMYIYTQIWTPDSQINTQTHPQTHGLDNQILTRSSARGQTDRPHRDGDTQTLNLSQTGTHTLTCGERREGHPQGQDGRTGKPVEMRRWRWGQVPEPQPNQARGLPSAPGSPATDTLWTLSSTHSRGTGEWRTPLSPSRPPPPPHRGTATVFVDQILLLSNTGWSMATGAR